jgi:hypothetical protein
MVSGETLTISNEVLIELTLGQCPLTTWEFVAYNSSVDLGCRVLWLGNEEVPLWLPGVQPHLFTNVRGSSKVVLTRWMRVVMVHLEGPPEVMDSLAGLGSMVTH